jgi:hypothetical protein
MQYFVPPVVWGAPGTQAPEELELVVELELAELLDAPDEELEVLPLVELAALLVELELLPLGEPEPVDEAELAIELVLVVPPPAVPEPPWPAPVEEPCAPPVAIAGEPSCSPPQWVSPSPMISKESDCKTATRMEVSFNTY